MFFLAVGLMKVTNDLFHKELDLNRLVVDSGIAVQKFAWGGVIEESSAEFCR